MSTLDETDLERLQAIMTSLLERQLGQSLKDVDQALNKWRGGDIGVFEAHAEVLRHAARAERVADRMSQVGLDNAGSLLRDAHDMGIVDDDEFEKLVGAKPEDVEPSPPLLEDERRDSSKRELVEELLAAGPVLVHIDARHADCHVPAQFTEDPKLVLRFGYGLTPAIIDLSIDEEALCGTLTFGGVPHRCILGWQGVYAVVSEVDQKGMVWPEDVPKGVLDSLTQGTADSADVETPAPAGTPEGEPKKRGSHLKLVK